MASTPVPAPECWTTATLEKHLDHLKDYSDKQTAAQDKQRGRQHQLAWGVFLLVAAVILFGLYLAYEGNSFGEKIVGATIAFLAGASAGYGSAKAGY